MMRFTYDPIKHQMATDLNYLDMQFRETLQCLKYTLMHLKIIVGIIFLAVFFKLLFEVGVVEWYNGILDGVITCGVLGIYVYLCDLEGKL